MKCLFGVETEYGLIDLDPERPWSPEELAEQLFIRVRSELPGVIHSRSGIFLASGARCYLDCGAHPEYCTPECTNPTDVVCHIRAGEEILIELLAEVKPTARLVRSNIQYGCPPATWGCHESHAHQVSRTTLSKALVAHFVTRVIFTGAGGLDPTHAGVRFAISPRAMMFASRRSASRVISIDDTRDESLAGGPWRRLHVVFGETDCLDVPLWLRLATTALIAGLAAERRIAGREIPQLEDPVAALHAITLDPTLSTAVAVLDGGRRTALDIQRGYLELVEREAARGDLPPWTETACAVWRDTLDALTLGSASAVGVCDWALKREIFTRRLEGCDLDWTQVQALYDDIAEPSSTPSPADQEDSVRPSREIEVMLGRARIRRNPLPLQGPHRDDRARLLELRRTLAEVDVHFGLRPGGIVERVAPDLMRSAPGVTPEAIRHALTNPPVDTRAAARGAAIRKARRSLKHLRANWDEVRDVRKGRRLSMPDPFDADARWEEVTPEPELIERDRCDDVSQLFDDVSRLYNQGNYRRLQRTLSASFERFGENPQIAAHLQPYQAWAQSRTGNIAQARRALRELYPRDDLDFCLKQLSVHRFQGLQPHGPRTWKWIRRCDRANHARWAPSAVATYLGHKGYFLSRLGRQEEAEAVLRDSVEIGLGPPNHQRLTARNHCDLADCLRLQGRRGEARHHLAQARAIFTTHGYDGELADHWMLTTAKLDRDAARGRELLLEARRIQRRMGNPIGVLRSTLLLARMSNRRIQHYHAHRLAERLRREIADLRTCRRLRDILARWCQWTDDPSPCRHGDPYWLL